MTASKLTLPATGSDVITEKNASDEHGQGVVLLRSDTLTPVTIDANGQKMYLATAIPAGTNNIGDVDVLTVPADPFGANADAASATGSISAKLRELAANGVTLKAGTAEIGKVEISDGTTQAEVTAAGTHKGVYTAMLDQDGEALSFALPLPASVSPTMDAATYTAGDSLQDAAFSIANAVTGNGRTAHLLGLRIIDKDDQGVDLVIDFFRSAPSTVPAAQDPYTLDDTDAAKVCGFIDTSLHGEWRDLGGARIWQMTRSPVPLVCTATTLYLLASTKGTPTYTPSGLIIEPTLARD